MRDLKFRIMYKRYDNIWIKNEYELRDLIEMDGNGFLDDDDIIEQYTGLKDRNGREIYEGDIVEYVEGFYRAETSEFEDIKDTGIVVWNTEYSGFMIQNFDGVYGTMGECEVIGNIHETNMEELCPKE